MSLKSFEKTGTNEFTIKFSIDGETFADACTKVFNKNRTQIVVPGFRKGKAPRALVEKYYGENVFYEDAFELVFADVYEAAIEESGIDAVGNPFDLNIESMGREGVELICKVSSKPEIKLGAYSGLKAEKEAVVITDEDVDAALKAKQDENARLIDIDDRAVENGDVAVIDYEGIKDGVPFDGGVAEDYNLTIGSGSFIPGFEEQIIGHTVGENFDINVTFPEEYGEADLAGQAVIFKIKLKGIKLKDIPVLDDEFAKDISEFDTLDELKADIKKGLTETRQAEVDKAFEAKLLDMVIDSVEAEIPQCMIEKATDDMINDMDYRLRLQGIDLATYARYMGLEMDGMRESYKDQAEKDVKLMLALEKIIELENIEATAEEIEEQYNKFAEGYGMKVEDIKNAVSEKTVAGDIKSKKAIDFIVANAKEGKPAAKKAAPKKTTKKADADSEASEPKEKKPAAKKTTKKAAEEKTEATEE